jgi:predicted FMN-binding regulatory protein PaiB
VLLHRILALGVTLGYSELLRAARHSSKRRTTTKNDGTNSAARQVEANSPVATRCRDTADKETRGSRAKPWAVSDAPADFIASQLRGIVALRIPVLRLEGKRKISQNRPETDRVGVVAGLTASDNPQDREVAPLIPLTT